MKYEKNTLSYGDKILLAASDLDGTLLYDFYTLSERTETAIKSFKETGGTFAVITGRTLCDVHDNVRKNPYIDYVSTSNGAQIFDNHTERVVSSALMDAELAKRMMRIARDSGISFWLQLSFENEVYPDDRVLDLGRPIEKLNFNVYTPEDRKTLFGIFEKFDTVSVSSGGEKNVELNIPDGSKGKALYRLCRLLNIDKRNTAAFGDNINDISMFKEAGLSVATENANDITKEEALYITDSCSRDGVAKVLEKLA